MIVRVLSLFVNFFAIASTLVAATSTFAQSVVTQQNYPGLIVSGTAGSNYAIQYVDAVSNVFNWATLTNITLQSAPVVWIDAAAGDAQKRFYRKEGVDLSIRNYIGLTITGTPGSTNLIQYTDLQADTNTWTTLTNLVLPTSPYLFFDTVSSPGRRRYRAEDLARPPVITSSARALGQVGTPTTYQITAHSYIPITSYDASGLPAGMNIDTSTGIISGSAAAEGTNLVTIIARNATGPGSATLRLSIRRSLATEMASIPAGTFLMGSPTTEAGRSANEGPQTQIAITHSFSIGKYEVSQEEYSAVVGVNPSSFKDDLKPVEFLTWPDATNFCALLTARDRQSGYISATSFYRLPTEAEWEYSARAGTTTRYAFGDSETNLNQYGWFSLNSDDKTHRVGEKIASQWGLYDMYGNTWEFCSDWIGSYPGGVAIDPQGAAAGTERVIRGGSWFNMSNLCRSAQRFGFGPAQRSSAVGFRIVLITQ